MCEFGRSLSPTHLQVVCKVLFASRIFANMGMMTNFQAISEIFNVQSTDHEMIPRSGKRVWRGAGDS